MNFESYSRFEQIRNFFGNLFSCGKIFWYCLVYILTILFSGAVSSDYIKTAKPIYRILDVTEHEYTKTGSGVFRKKTYKVEIQYDDETIKILNIRKKVYENLLQMNPEYRVIYIFEEYHSDFKIFLIITLIVFGLVGIVCGFIYLEE
jgi:hypothetical protein